MVRCRRQGCEKSSNCSSGCSGCSACNRSDVQKNIEKENPVKLEKSHETISFLGRIFNFLISIFSAVFYYFRRLLKIGARPNSRAQTDSTDYALLKKEDDLLTTESEKKRQSKSLGRAIVRDISSLLHLKTSDDEDDTKNNSTISSSIKSDAAERRSIANAIIRRRLELEKPESIRRTFRVHACTWNVDRNPPPESSHDLCEWLLGNTLMGKLRAYHTANINYQKDGKGTPPVLPIADFPDLVVVSLQEVEMGGVVLVREYTETGVSWAEAIVEALNKASEHKLWYRKLKMVQLVGLVLIVVIRVEHANYVINVRASLTRTGAMRGVWGNKGSVGLRATIYGKRFLLIAAHFVAHKHNERTRRFNYYASLRDLRFEAQVDVDDETEVLQMFSTFATDSDQIRGAIANHSAWARLFGQFRRYPSIGIERRVLDQHDYVFFLGDLNSRLHGVKSTDIRRLVRCKDYDRLICCDELRQGMISGDTFDGFQEPVINFPPTYKFDRGTDLYDTSYKKRDPAWCDRILFRVCLPCEDDVNYSIDSGKKNNAITITTTTTTTSTTSSRSSSNDKSSSISRNNGSCSINSGSNHRNVEEKTSRAGPDNLLLSHAYEPLHKSAEDVRGEPSSSSSDSSSGRDSSFKEKRNKTLYGEIPGTNLWDSLRSIDSTGSSSSGSPTVDIASVEAKQLPTFLSARRSTCTDRRLIFPMVPNRVSALDYHHIPTIRESDHRPVCAQFDVDVLSIGKDLVDEVMKEMYERISEEYPYYIA
ncbi:Endonuclease/exonuclease/phosphatase [Trypanosoma melophagium]|uniref:Endonuclease/exonuclease/phosphatase n=1 Tax=Trypanosoma melophagium TaxID=715481 RepID=UPI00351AAF91|nr:Endonuclease/exonuclease/phosphatase [Trypanosoma melophagium]